MTGTRQTLGVIVEKTSDYGVKIASKDKVFEDCENFPPSLALGDWVITRDDFNIVSPTTRVPLRSRVEDGKVQVLSYVTVPFGHCSLRDEYILPDNAKVWSPHLAYAYSEPDVMLGLREEILYEAWFQYRTDRIEDELIWELKVVGEAIIDPAKTIMLKETPWKLHSRRVEVGDTSLSAVLNADRFEVDRYHHGMVVALISKPEPEVILYSPSCGGTISTNEKKGAKSMFHLLSIGQVVKFREREESNRKYADIKETLNTTRQDIQFKVKTEKHHFQTIQIRTSIAIDEDLCTAGVGTMHLLCNFGPVTAYREKFARQMEAVCLEADDLVEAQKEGKELQVWIVYVPVSASWSLSHIDDHWFTKKAEEISL